MFKEVKEKVDYADLLELGFNRVNMDDEIHRMKYGYPYFILAYGEDGEKICMEWSPITREVNLYINSHTYKEGISLDEVKRIIIMLNDNV